MFKVIIAGGRDFYDYELLQRKCDKYLWNKLCFWDGKSKGTKHTIDLCKKKGIPVKIVRYENI